MFNDSSTDFSDDIESPIGCDLFYAFAIQPLNVTGCTATFITDFGTFPVVLSVDIEGDQAVSTFTVSIAPGSLPTDTNVHTWKIRVVFPSGQTLPYGSGSILFTS